MAQLRSAAGFGMPGAQRKISMKHIKRKFCNPSAQLDHGHRADSRVGGDLPRLNLALAEPVC